MTDVATAPYISDAVTAAFAECRDAAEKLELVVVALAIVGGDALGEDLKAWRDAKQAPAVNPTGATVDEIKARGGVESAEAARALAGDDDLPDTGEGPAFDDNPALVDPTQFEKDENGDLVRDANGDLIPVGTFGAGNEPEDVDPES